MPQNVELLTAEKLAYDNEHVGRVVESESCDFAAINALFDDEDVCKISRKNYAYYAIKPQEIQKNSIIKFDDETLVVTMGSLNEAEGVVLSARSILRPVKIVTEKYSKDGILKIMDREDVLDFYKRNHPKKHITDFDIEINEMFREYQMYDAICRMGKLLFVKIEKEDNSQKVYSLAKKGDRVDRIYLLMERNVVDLTTYLNNVRHYHYDKSCDEMLQIVKKAVFQVIKEVQLIHDTGARHGDIKPPNFMIDPQGNIKIIDFASYRTQQDENQETLGTVGYNAPEFQKKNENNVLYKKEPAQKGQIDTAETYRDQYIKNFFFTGDYYAVGKVIEKFIQKYLMCYIMPQIKALADLSNVLSKKPALKQHADTLLAISTQLRKSNYTTAKAQQLGDILQIISQDQDLQEQTSILKITIETLSKLNTFIAKKVAMDDVVVKLTKDKPEERINLQQALIAIDQAIPLCKTGTGLGFLQNQPKPLERLKLCDQLKRLEHKYEKICKKQDIINTMSNTIFSKPPAQDIAKYKEKISALQEQYIEHLQAAKITKLRKVGLIIANSKLVNHTDTPGTISDTAKAIHQIYTQKQCVAASMPPEHIPCFPIAKP